MASKIGVVPVTNPEGGDNRAAQKQDPPISLSQEGSRLSRTVLTSIEQLRKFGMTREK